MTDPSRWFVGPYAAAVLALGVIFKSLDGCPFWSFMIFTGWILGREILHFLSTGECS